MSDIHVFHLEDIADSALVAAKEIEAWYGSPEWEQCFKMTHGERVAWCEAKVSNIIYRAFLK